MLASSVRARADGRHQDLGDAWSTVIAYTLDSIDDQTFDLGRSKANSRTLRGLRLVCSVFGCFARAQLLSAYLVFTTSRQIDAFIDAIADGSVDAAACAEVTIASRVTEQHSDTLSGEFDEIMRGWPLVARLEDSERRVFMDSMGAALGDAVELSAASSVAHRPFCRSIVRLLAQLPRLGTLRVGHMRSVVRGWLGDPVPSLPRTVILSSDDADHDEKYQVVDLVRLGAALVSSPDARLHIHLCDDVLSNASGLFSSSAIRARIVSCQLGRWHEPLEAAADAVLEADAALPALERLIVHVEEGPSGSLLTTVHGPHVPPTTLLERFPRLRSLSFSLHEPSIFPDVSSFGLPPCVEVLDLKLYPRGTYLLEGTWKSWIAGQVDVMGTQIAGVPRTACARAVGLKLLRINASPFMRANDRAVARAIRDSMLKLFTHCRNAGVAVEYVL